MNLKALLIAAATPLITPLAAQADFWDHNGSIMYMAESDAGLYIDYEQPREGLAALGVRPGTRLFQGRFLADGSVVGTANVYKQGCQPADYEVRGEFIGENKLRIVGYAPIRGKGKQACNVVDYDRAKNSVLIFNFLYDDGH